MHDDNDNVDKMNPSPNQVAPAAAANNNSAEELSALRAEVERLEIAAQESRLAQQSKHNAELADIRGQFDESERRIRAYEMDVQVSQSDQVFFLAAEVTMIIVIRARRQE